LGIGSIRVVVWTRNLTIQAGGLRAFHNNAFGSHNSDQFELRGSHLLVAGGRTPNTSGIGLYKAGVETNERGYVKVNEQLQTTADAVWAMGDCAGSPHFTHISVDDFLVVSENTAGRRKVTTGRQVPFCMFTDPEFARVGLSETEAKQRGIPYRVAKLPMAAVFRAMTVSETRGFMKILIDAESDRILGFTMFGTGAGDVLATVQIAMLTSAPYTTLRDAIIAHPPQCRKGLFLCCYPCQQRRRNSTRDH
jgi:pyruvate/2-oxoglutarate dehydrogenase complex dihydrolipoamide dehydrogenase (E3) component